MIKTLFLTFIALAPILAIAQDSHKPTGTPFALPLSIDEKGNLKLFGEATKDFSVNPNLLVGAMRGSLLYSFPKTSDQFIFSPIDQNNGFVSVRKQRIEVGLGLSALAKSISVVGLTPYKGALATITQFKNHKNEKNHPFSMPKKIEDLESWTVGDRGTYETYGGVVTYVAVSAGIVDISKFSVSFQNDFEVEMSKIDENRVALTITEGKLVSRKLRVGPFVASFTKSRYAEEGIRADFIFDLRDPHHAVLFRKALKGDFVAVADELDRDLQKISWNVDEKEFFFGMPMVAGRTNARAHYEMDEGGQKYEVDYKQAQNNGIFTATRVHQKTVFQTEESIALIWSSQMNQVEEGALKRNFLSIGQILDAPGFEVNFKTGTKFGTLFTQLGVDFTKEEFISMQTIDSDTLRAELRYKCEVERLSCKKEKRLNKILKKYSSLATKTWKESRDQLGLLFTEEPALLSTAIKLTGLKKKLYFKFLSEKFQSVEGMAQVGT